MPNLLAICDNCSAIFESDFSVGPGGSGLYIGNKSGPCPRCESLGTVPDAEYIVLGTSIYATALTATSRSQLEGLANVVRSAYLDKDDPDSIRMALRGLGFDSLADLLPTNRRDLYTFLLVLLTALTFIAEQGWNYLEYRDRKIAEELERKAISEQVRSQLPEILERAAVLGSTKSDGSQSERDFPDSSDTEK